MLGAPTTALKLHIAVGMVNTIVAKSAEFVMDSYKLLDINYYAGAYLFMNTNNVICHPAIRNLVISVIYLHTKR